ncbi:Hypp2487 [Branchiostoma lanceolatum]|uniref:Hypp2487 protein n=1 Tax=Branchiostoma lanceolatum TaxID=7740 RepID=A0A8K0EQ56_BRALA|nr:Hypp2487 [Branchiostoma lanceolatum]
MPTPTTACPLTQQPQHVHVHREALPHSSQPRPSTQAGTLDDVVNTLAPLKPTVAARSREETGAQPWRYLHQIIDGVSHRFGSLFSEEGLYYLAITSLTAMEIDV